MEAKYAGIILTGPTDSEHCGRIEIPLDVATQVVPLVRSDAPYVASLGNQAHIVTIEITRRYASLLDAMQARASLPRSLPLTGQLELWQDSLASTLIITAAEAVKAACPSPVLIGRSVAYRFTFLCPVIAAVQAITGSVLRAEDGSILYSEEGFPLLAE